MAAREPRRPALDNVVEAPFRAPVERRSALDRAHRGDIVGAFGTLSMHDTAPRASWRRRLAALLAVLGPGVLVMVADNDAGGLSVYAQAGEDYGIWMVWLLLGLAPVLFVIQEMVARLGAVTGAGHARLIFERFGKGWGRFALGDLLLLNLLTIVTEFIGVTMALGYFGVERHVAVCLAAVALVGVTSLGSFRRWEIAMFGLVAVSLAIVPVAALATARHGAPGLVGDGVAVPGAPGFLLLVIAIVGTTVAPWQLFFHQSNVVDKRITPLWLPYERWDLGLGTVLFTVGALAVTVIAAVVLGDGGASVRVIDLGSVAIGLEHAMGPWAGAAFAIAVLDGSVLGASAVTLATSYAIGDALGTRHSLHRRWRDAPLFHGSFALSLVVAASLVLAPGVPLGVVTLGVQALAGVLLPSAAVLLLLLCNDRDVLGPRVNPRWLNVLATLVVAGLLEISALLTLTILFPGLNVVLAAALIGAVLVGVGGTWLWASRRGGGRAIEFTGSAWEKATWSMPPLESLPAPHGSASRTVGLAILRVYLVFATGVVAVRVVEAIIHR